MAASYPRRVYWLLAGSRQQASSRLHGFLIHDYLQACGWKSVILFSPRHLIQDLPADVNRLLTGSLFQRDDLVVVQKLFGPNTCDVMADLRRRNVPLVYIDCDLPIKIAEASLASLVVCPSETLASLYRAQGIKCVRVLPEMYEAFSAPSVRHTSRLNCVWFGCMDAIKAREVQALRYLIRRSCPDYNLIVISNRYADSEWKLPSAWEHIRACDVAVITGTQEPTSLIKSPNRVVQAMALGLPVIAAALPSYSAVIGQCRNALLYSNDQELLEALRAIRDQNLRSQLANCGFRYARRYFSPEVVGARWKTEFARLVDPVIRGPRGHALSLTEKTGIAEVQVLGLRSIYRQLEPFARLCCGYAVEFAVKTCIFYGLRIASAIRNLLVL